MTTKKIYGPWIKWHGGECPVPPDTLVGVKFRKWALGRGGRAGGYYWHHGGGADDIVEYRTVIEQPDLDAAEQLLRVNGYNVVPPVKPSSASGTGEVGMTDTIDTLRAQLAEAQRDSERLDWMIEQCAYVVSDPDCCDGYWLNYARPDGTLWTQATEHETPRAAIDAAKGESNG